MLKQIIVHLSRHFVLYSLNGNIFIRLNISVMASRLFYHLTINSLQGIGQVLAAKFEKLGLITVQDLLLHLPFRYENRNLTHNITDLIPGTRIAIKGIIVQKKLITGRRRMLVCSVSDGTGIINLRFLNFSTGLQNSLVQGREIKAYGEIKQGKLRLEMIHPQFNLKKSLMDQEENETLTPIYYTTDGLTQTIIRKTMKQALLFLKHNPPDELIPTNLLDNLPGITEALSIVHNPPLSIDATHLEQGKHPAQSRLIIEELLAYQLSMQLNRNFRSKKQAYPLHCHENDINQFITQLPFSLTSAQRRAITEINGDMQKARPMMRLIQGDVGSGKTLAAASAAFQAINNNKQVVLIAPTEILAEQHYHNFKQWFAAFSIPIECVTGSTRGRTKKTQFSQIACGNTKLIIGTHAIFHDKVKFDNLALIIIDEQHRFGVAQRLILWQKGTKQDYYPHQLIMTATPIPRTLAMTIYTDLEISTIDELPPGRIPVTTVVIPNSKRPNIITRIKAACNEGRQVYWVCTLIEESGQLEAQAAENLAEILQNSLAPFQVGLIHGRMKTQKKQEIMKKFKQGNIQLLVATTVIEVGVDVPNASLMIIENAERLGLAQLHQLRGRVGRGNVASHCILLYQPPLSKIAKARLEVMRNSTDGFIIAQKDMEIRGIGDILGTKQMGSADFKIVDLIRDQHLIARTQHLSQQLIDHYPEQAQQLIHCWLPDRQKYINA